mmetsp:Transcript_29098/g.88020  ORF Transcript_29098/g.88020 Transcript_29098/m.88020 type:complete len:295 (+) Transcript_29098:832-1716(+)
MARDVRHRGCALHHHRLPRLGIHTGADARAGQRRGPGAGARRRRWTLGGAPGGPARVRLLQTAHFQRADSPGHLRQHRHERLRLRHHVLPIHGRQLVLGRHHLGVRLGLRWRRHHDWRARGRRHGQAVRPPRARARGGVVAFRRGSAEVPVLLGYPALRGLHRVVPRAELVARAAGHVVRGRGEAALAVGDRAPWLPEHDHGLGQRHRRLVGDALGRPAGGGARAVALRLHRVRLEGPAVRRPRGERPGPGPGDRRHDLRARAGLRDVLVPLALELPSGFAARRDEVRGRPLVG